MSETAKISYTVREATQALGIGRTTLYELIAAKKLSTFKLCGRTLIARQELERLVSEAQQAA